MILTVDLANQWGDVTAGFVSTVDSPNDLAGIALDGQHIAVTVMIPIEDDQIFVDDGVAAKTMSTDEVADSLDPLSFAVHIVSSNSNAPRSAQPLAANVGGDHFTAIDFQKRDVLGGGKKIPNL